jgi:hypothetical protein
MYLYLITQVLSKQIPHITSIKHLVNKTSQELLEQNRIATVDSRLFSNYLSPSVKLAPKQSKPLPLLPSDNAATVSLPLSLGLSSLCLLCGGGGWSQIRVFCVLPGSP